MENAHFSVKYILINYIIKIDTYILNKMILCGKLFWSVIDHIHKLQS